MHGNSIVDVDLSNYQNESAMHGSSIIDVDPTNYRNEPTMHGNLMVDVDLNNDPKESTMHGNSVVDVDLNNSQTKQRYIETQLLMLAQQFRVSPINGCFCKFPFFFLKNVISITRAVSPYRIQNPALPEMHFGWWLNTPN
jgi:hypothetical protein